jgi:hypothetical protein
MNCELLERTKDLAHKKGLPVNLVRCSMGSTCDGSDCIFFPNTQNLEPPRGLAFILRQYNRKITYSGKR